MPLNRHPPSDPRVVLAYRGPCERRNLNVESRTLSSTFRNSHHRVWWGALLSVGGLAALFLTVEFILVRFGAAGQIAQAQAAESTQSAEDNTALRANPAGPMPSRSALGSRVDALSLHAWTTDAPTGLQRAAECLFRSPIHVHSLAVGERLADVAGQYGVRIRDLVYLNPNLVTQSQPRVGTPIRVCPALPPHRPELRWHTVRADDSWVSIATEYEIPVAQLMQANQKIAMQGALIERGQKVAIPLRGEVIPGFPSGEGSERAGVLKNGAPLPPSPYYELKRPWLNFGSAATVQSVQQMAERYWEQSAGHRLLLGDLSRPDGGPLTGHRSHQQGRDIDIGIPLRKGERRDRFVVATASNIDLARTWALVETLLEDPNLAFIFVDMSVQREIYAYAQRQGVSQELLDEVFQYPRKVVQRYGVIRHFKGHVDHLHVRFRQ